MDNIDKEFQIKKSIVSLIKDKNLKMYLFELEPPYDDETIKEDIIFDHQVVEKIIYLLFMFYYSLYLKQKEDISNKYIKNKRVITNFDKLFINQEISLDFMLFILSELQITRDNTDFLKDDLPVTEWKKELNLYRSKSKAIGKSQIDILEKLYKTIKSAPILQMLKLIFVENDENSVFGNEVKTVDFEMAVDHEKIYIPSNHMILVDAKYNAYYYGVNSIKYQENTHVARYKSLNNKNKFSEYIKLKFKNEVNDRKTLRSIIIEQVFKKNTLEDEEAILMNKLYGKGFDKIRILALAIADLINNNSNRYIGVKIKQKYLINSELSHLISNIHNQDKINWDNPITILLIEVGPSELLSNILDDHEFIFRRIMENISKRVNDTRIKEKMINKYEKIRTSTDNTLLRDKFTSSKHRENHYLNYERKLMVKTIIEYLNNLSKEKDELSYPGIVESLPNRIRHYKEIVMSSKSRTKKVIEINYLFEEVFKFLNVFYSGLIGYSNEYFSLDLDNLKPLEIQKKCEDAFIKDAEKEINNLRKASIGKLVGQFKEILKTTYGKEVTPDGENLNGIIGRFEVCPFDAFSELVDYQKDGQYDFTKMINNIKHSDDHSKGTVEPPTNEDYRDFYRRGLDILMLLLKNNSSNIRESYFSDDVSLMPVFPYTIQFNMNRKKKDGYDIKSYSMESLDNTIKDIKILSTREHTEHENYYCIPNAMSSTKKYWIEPFFIRSEILDNILIKKED